MSSMNYLFSVVTLVIGIYGLYVWVVIRKSGNVPANSILLPKDRTLADCIDADAFLAYTCPRLLIFSVLIGLYGIFCAADTMFDLIGQWVVQLPENLQGFAIQVLTCVLPMGILIWFALSLNKIQKELWH